MTKFKIPAGFIDVAQEGTLISLIGDNAYGGLFLRRRPSLRRAAPLRRAGRAGEQVRRPVEWEESVTFPPPHGDSKAYGPG